MKRALVAITLTAWACLVASPALACSFAEPRPNWRLDSALKFGPSGQIYATAINETGDAGPLEISEAFLFIESDMEQRIELSPSMIDVPSFMGSENWPDQVSKLVLLDVPADATLEQTTYNLLVVGPAGELEPLVFNQIAFDPGFSVEPPSFGTISVEVEQVRNWGETECCTQVLDPCEGDDCYPEPICSREICAPTSFDYPTIVRASVETTPATVPGRYAWEFVAIQGEDEARTRVANFDEGEEFEVCFVVETTDFVTGDITRTEPTCATHEAIVPIEREEAPGLAADACSAETDPETEPDPETDPEVDPQTDPDSTPAGTLGGEGCGCAQGQSDASPLLLLVLLALIRVRRQTASD